MSDKEIARVSAGTPPARQAMGGKDNVGGYIAKPLKAKCAPKKLNKKAR